MGLSGIEMFEATLLKRNDVDDAIKTLPKVVLCSVFSEGNISWLSVDNNGNPVLSSSLNLKLDDQGMLITHSGDVKFGLDINMNFNRIKDQVCQQLFKMLLKWFMSIVHSCM